MSIFDIFKVKNVITAPVTDKQNKRSIMNEVDLYSKSLDRARADITKWREALTEWERPDFPDRYEMIQLYQEIEQDDSVVTHFDSILQKILGTAFEVGTKNSAVFTCDEAKTELLKSEWFEQVVKHILESEMMGFSVVEVKTPIEQLTIDDIELIPRELVIPEWNKVRTRHQQKFNLIDLDNPLFAPRLLKVGDKKGKGLYNSIAPLYIYKKNAISYWSNFQSKFGVPPIIAKTDLTDKQNVSALKSFLQEMRSNSFALVGLNDELEVLNGVNTDSFNTFEKLMLWCDQQIAKVLEGQTMTSNDGSSRSQAQVHQETGNDRHLARLRRIERIIVTKLFPILGWFDVTGRFKEVKNSTEFIDNLVKLSQAGYTVAPEYVSEQTGIPVGIKEIAPISEKTGANPNITAPSSLIKTINDLYNDELCC